MRRAVFTLALVPLVVSCGAVSSVRDPNAGLVDKKAGIGSSRIVVTSHIDFPVDESFRTTGAVDYEQGAGIIESTSDGEFAPEIFTREATYEPLGNEGLEPIDSRRWVRYDPPRNPLGDFEPLIFETYFGESPTEMLDFLRAGTSVEKVAEGKERGEQVTRYRARLYLERALQRIPANQRDYFRHDFGWCWADFEKTGVPLEFAVDAKGRLRRVDVTSFCKGVRSDWMIEFFDYGIDVDAKAPPADEVMTVEELDQLWDQLAASSETDD